jgi:TatD DNase family protein
MLVDTHIHLYAKEFESDRDDLINKAHSNGVELFLMPNISVETIPGMLELNDKFNFCLPMFGLHPCDVNESYISELDKIKEQLILHRNKTIAIGETGMDMYWDKTYLKEQTEAFTIQLEWCIEFNLPVVIHSRESLDLILDILEKKGNNKLSGVFHCFSGTVEQVDRINSLGFYFGIGGVVTFKNGGLDKLINKLPDDRLILETDGPYLAPAPFRGKRNEPIFLRNIAEKVAQLKGVSVQEIEDLTTNNAAKLFNLDIVNK